MPYGRRAKIRIFSALLVASVLTSLPAAATWSVIALDPHSGTFAVAAASCSNQVYGIHSVVPGKGVVIVQANSNGEARQKAVAMLREARPLDDILRTISAADSGFDPAHQQYALLASGADHRARSFTGDDVPASKGTYAADFLSVQVNLMASDEVLARTRNTLGKPDWKDDLGMARRVIQAMEAGATAGGDRRCGAVNSATAFIGLYRKGDPEDAPWMELSVHDIAPGTQSGLAALRTLFDRWLEQGTEARSTRLFVVPAPRPNP